MMKYSLLKRPHTLGAGGATFLGALATAGMLWMPIAASAATFTVSIDESIFGGLGDCGTPTIGTPSTCSGPEPVEINQGPSANPNWPDWGIGKAFDLIRMRQVSLTVDSSASPANLAQIVDFAVGGTGGGSAGDPGSSLLYPISLTQSVVIDNDGAHPYTLVQSGTLEVGWTADTLRINAADLNVTLSGGTQVTLHFGALGPILVDGDPSFDIPITVSSVPEPSTYALLCLGVGALGLIRRRAAAPMLRT